MTLREETLHGLVGVHAALFKHGVNFMLWPVMQYLHQTLHHIPLLTVTPHLSPPNLATENLSA